MSRSKTSSNESSSAEARNAHQRLSQMMRQGRSFSGRERNCCFLNVGDNRFATVSAVTGFDLPDDGRALATVDWDNDGDLDVFTTNRNAPRLRFLQNNGPSGEQHNFLTLHLVGDGKSSNVDAIGARVEVIVTDGEKQNTLIRTVRAGEGFLTHNGHGLHIGLGSAMEIETVTISWPAGKVQSLSGLEASGHYQVVQGKDPERITPPSVNLPGESPIVKTSVNENTRIPFVRQLPSPELAVESLSGQPTRLNTGQKSLLLLWSTTCRPCIEELRSLK
ncbi:MAG: CRTAC1 family protein, partial [Planctomycetota bacterium]